MPSFLAGPAELSLCASLLWDVVVVGSWVSMSEMLVSPFWKGSLHSSLQSLAGECT